MTHQIILELVLCWHLRYCDLRDYRAKHVRYTNLVEKQPGRAG